MEQDKDSAQQKDKLKRKNLMLGWAIGLLTVALYFFAILYK